MTLVATATVEEEEEEEVVEEEEEEVEELDETAVTSLKGRQKGEARCSEGTVTG